jgi:hypothetical protein
LVFEGINGSLHTRTNFSVIPELLQFHAMLKVNETFFFRLKDFKNDARLFSNTIFLSTGTSPQRFSQGMAAGPAAGKGI